MSKNKIKLKKVIIKDTRFIPLLKNVQGPILNPTEMEVDLIGQLVVSGFHVEEYLGGNKFIRLTVSNFDKDNGVADNKRFKIKRDLVKGGKSVKVKKDTAEKLKQSPTNKKSQQKEKNNNNKVEDSLEPK